MSAKIYVPRTLVRTRANGMKNTYKMLEFLGRGGFASVYKAREEDTNQLVAIKIIPLSEVTRPSDRKRLEVENNIMASLDHENICKSYGHFSDERNHYIIMELCSKGSLVSLLSAHGHLPEERVAEIIHQIVEGIKFLHDHRIIHRDLKLENVLIGEDDKIKLSDFGLSAQLDYDDERRFTRCGTPNYLSPEIVSNNTRGHSYEVDIWAIGICTYTLLVGRPPFETREPKRTYELIKKGKYTFPETISVSYYTKDFIKKVLQVAPELRPTAQDVAMHPFFSQSHGKQKGEGVDTMSYRLIKYCDLRNSGGIGYLLKCGVTGAIFGDGSRMAMDPGNRFIQYWATIQDGAYTVLDADETNQDKKVAILLKAAAALKKASDEHSSADASEYLTTKPLPHMKYWMKDGEDVLFRANDRAIQLNFADKVKLLVTADQSRLCLVKTISTPGTWYSFRKVVNNRDTFTDEYTRLERANEMLGQLFKQP